MHGQEKAKPNSLFETDSEPDEDYGALLDLSTKK